MDQPVKFYLHIAVFQQTDITSNKKSDASIRIYSIFAYKLLNPKITALVTIFSYSPYSNDFQFHNKI